MQVPVQITFRGMDPSDAVKQAVNERAGRLERFYDKIESCRVVVEAPHRRRQKGNLYSVTIRLAVPGEDVVVSRVAPPDVQHEDLYLAIHDAFKEATRKLEDHVRRRRRKVKQHEPPPRARVVRIFKDEGYGFLATPDGREIYFHENSVLHGAFRRLDVDTEVRFAEEQGEKGPQASTVSPVGGET